MLLAAPNGLRRGLSAARSSPRRALLDGACRRKQPAAAADTNAAHNAALDESGDHSPRGGAAATPKALEGRVEASRCRRQRGVRRGPDWAAGCQMMEKLVSVAISR